MKPLPRHGIIDPASTSGALGGRKADMEMGIGILLVLVSIVEIAGIINIVRGNYPTGG